jgi:N-acetyl-anhydromuramyl-L-alanine amidase AmpD
MISLNTVSFGLLKDTLKYASNVKNNEAVELTKLNLNDIIQIDFPDEQYFREQTEKKQIVLHHTVSGQGVDGDISYWRSTVERIGTAIIVGWDGKIYQCFSTKYWAHHLGTHEYNNIALNKGSIGIEIDAWGGLMKLNGKWYPAKWDAVKKKNVPNTKVKPIQNVQEYPEGYRGYYGFEKYTDAQIESVKKLLIFWGEKYNIPLNFHSDMFNVSKNALSGMVGIWSHTSFRADKSDIHPQNELIQMLKSLI